MKENKKDGHDKAERRTRIGLFLCPKCHDLTIHDAQGCYRCACLAIVGMTPVQANAQIENLRERTFADDVMDAVKKAKQGGAK